MTDGTFLEPLDVFSDGTPAEYSYAEVAAALERNRVRLFSVNASANGQGLSSNYHGRPSLVTSSGGSWFELASVDAGALALDALLSDLAVGVDCSVDAGNASAAFP